MKDGTVKCGTVTPCDAAGEFPSHKGEKKKKISVFTHAQSIISLYYQKNLHFGLRERLYFQNVTVFRTGCNLFCFGVCFCLFLFGFCLFFFGLGFLGFFLQCQYLCICCWK